MKRICRMGGEYAPIAFWNLRHCRNEIAAKALVAHGIIGKPLMKCHASGRYWALRLEDPQTLKTLLVQIDAAAAWFPAAMKSGLWQQVLDLAAVSTNGAVDPLNAIASGVCSVFNDDVYGFAAFTKSIDLQDIFFPAEVRGISVRRRGPLEFYFDDNLVYCCREAASQKLELDEYFVKRVDGRVWLKAAASWREGYTASHCIDIYLKTSINYLASEYSFLDRLCTKIDKPSFERSPDTPRRDGCDRIRVTVCLNSSLFPTYKELLTCVGEHRSEIDKMVMDRVREANEQKGEQKVHLSEFKLTGIHVARDYTVDYVFEKLPGLVPTVAG